MSKNIAHSRDSEIYGFLAVMKLIQIAGYDAGLGDAAKRTLMIIAGFCDVNGQCYPSLSKISKNCRTTNAATLKQVKILEEHGYLKRTSVYGASGGRKPSILSLNIEMAATYTDCPYIFCKAHETIIVTYL